jgi:uncharacterized membrane protein YuzA (DUF378 family)
MRCHLWKVLQKCVTVLRIRGQQNMFDMLNYVVVGVAKVVMVLINYEVAKCKVIGQTHFVSHPI